MARLKGIELRLRRLRRRAAPLVYAGDAVHCPVCERSFRKFRTAGRRPARRPGAVCPHCAARERDRLAFLFLRTLEPVGRLLHIAPEACLAPALRRLAPAGYVSADLLREDVDERFDMLAIPHPRHTFGGVYCSHVLQDVRDDRRAMAEVLRVLKPGGWAILNVPVQAGRLRSVEHVDAPGNIRPIGDPRPPEHLRSYGCDFGERMAAAGFRVRVIAAGDLAERDEQARFGILGAAAGVVHFGTKP